MALQAGKTAVLAALGLGGIIALASCMQGGEHQTAATPQTTVPGFGLFYLDEGGSAKLAYGQANSDNVDFMLQCAKGSRTVEVTDVARSAGAPEVILASTGASARLRTRIEPGDGAPLLVAVTPMSTPPLAAFRRSGRLDVDQSGARRGLVATADERVGVERFFSACERG